jgi:hypothetical protein
MLITYITKKLFEVHSIHNARKKFSKFILLFFAIFWTIVHARVCRSPQRLGRLRKVKWRRRGVVFGARPASKNFSDPIGGVALAFGSAPCRYGKSDMESEEGLCIRPSGRSFRFDNNSATE